jgi:hypothetical protein
VIALAILYISDLAKKNEPIEMKLLATDIVGVSIDVGAFSPFHSGTGF